MANEVVLARDVMDVVRAACEKTGRTVEEGELRQALESLDSAELQHLRRVAREPLNARPIGPHALVDIARGVPPTVAAAREIGGYYELKAERDALATLAQRTERPASPRLDPAPPPAEEPEKDEPPAPRAKPAAQPPSEKTPAPRSNGQEEQALMTLFAYHRDAVRVAQELGIDNAELNERLDRLGLRRRIYRILESTTDIDMFSPEQVGGTRVATNPVPVLRRRSERVAPGASDGAVAASARSAPAADTTAVNIHGTRVYRRTEPAASVENTASSNLGPRREYVRESRRKTKPARATAVPSKPAPPAAPSKRPFFDLQAPSGAAILERLIADEKANPRVLAAKLGERFDGPDREINDSDLRSLLNYHDLGDTFREREIANTRFLIGFHQGARAKLANALQLNAEELSVYLSKLDLSADLEKTRSDRARIELSRRRIGDRIVQVLTRAPYLDDLGVLQVIDREVRDYLQQQFSTQTSAAAAEHIRAELGLEKNAFAKLLRRYDLAGKLEE